ncbi:unnamed protein product [Polarella glacialis]|uniref:Alpha-L-fucosidase n=1 Tax=Polarella glacialis TaxID=89957 RepID=A0A813GHC3_POLGL|nr:unnamed protein product [Polarella glacialis]
MNYLGSARPTRAWKGPLVHYNSWYDFTSWQDEGFFNPRRGRNQEEASYYHKLLQELTKDQMNEKAALDVIAAFHNELVLQRGAVLDSFLWDDGWDDPEEGMWAFNEERFPRGFSQLAKAAREINCSNGIWLSPWGGYGEAKEVRLRAAEAQALKMRQNAGVNFFKFDGVAGDPAEVAAEMEAMLGSVYGDFLCLYCCWFCCCLFVFILYFKP